MQARPVFVDGQLTDLRAERGNRAKELIADLMIAVNGATARFLADHGQPSLRRVLQQPRRWDRLVAPSMQSSPLSRRKAPSRASRRRWSSGRIVAGSAGLDVGDRVRLRLRSVDLEQRFIDFERV